MDRRTYLSLAGLSFSAGCVKPPMAELSSPADLLPLDLDLSANHELWALSDYGIGDSDIPPSKLDELEPYHVRVDGEDRPSTDSRGLHPLRTNRQLRSIVESVLSEDKMDRYRGLIHRFAQSFAETAIEHNGGMYFPYKFDFEVHGQPDLELTNPWFSGMAQGEILGTWSRLHSATGNNIYRKYAEQTYTSLVDLASPSSKRPWVSTRDADGYYWIEEYPATHLAHTLNGKLFATFGICEYHRLTNSENVEKTLQSILTTVLEHMDEFRVPGQPSHYCLGHHIMDSKYHHIHVRQLRHLNELTGISRFGNWATTLKNDYWEGST